MAIDIADFPINSMVISNGYVSLPGRVHSMTHVFPHIIHRCQEISDEENVRQAVEEDFCAGCDAQGLVTYKSIIRNLW